MKVLFLWCTFEGHFASCWRELSRRDGIDLHVVARRSDPRSLAPHGEALLEGISADLLDDRELHDLERLSAIVRALPPDAVVVPGWNHKPYMRLATGPHMEGVPLVMVMDNAWRSTWRQHLGRFRHPRFFRRVNLVVVAGERSRRFAHVLGFPPAKVRRGMYGCDFDRFQEAARKRAGGEEWPRRFLYAGRYLRLKGVDLLLGAYRSYRERVDDPWPLACCGRGPLQGALRRVAGVEDLGFLDPDGLAGVMARSGALVLPSRFEPWGVVLAEAGASGLPVLCTKACGASDDLVRDRSNGLVVESGSAEALAGALCWIHEHHDRLPEMGRRGWALAEPFSAVAWADRWQRMLETLPGPGSGSPEISC